VPALPPIERIPGGRAFASLSRRVRTLTIATALFLVLFILALTMPVPYVVLSPGPTFNTIGVEKGSQVIVIGGRHPNKTSGHLNMTTVSVSGDSVTAFQALSAWLMHDEVVVPRAAVYPPGESEEQTNEQNAQDFQLSQDSATAAALCELGYPKGFGVIDVVPDGPAHDVLEPGDFLVSVDGKSTNTSAKLAKVLSTEKPGRTVTVKVTRNKLPVDLEVTLAAPPKDRTGASLGIFVTKTKGCLAPFTVTIHLADIGGPSAGLMFALGIMDKVGTVDLTKGQFIAGTGTIDAKGNVGAIGGIQLKMIAARDKGATVFLAPARNCDDVRGATPDGLQVIKVSTLDEAVQDLLKIQQNESVPGC
jgi:PDZ domain-containing protein